ncbi:MAG: tetratricopeptide repeat protein, partial [Thiohalomonadaceae bacterium]
MQAHQSGRFDEARRLYEAVLKKHPRQAEAIHFLGVLEYQQQNYDKAIALMERSLRFPDCGRIAAWHSNLGLALHARGRSAEAIACCERAIRLDETYPEAHINLGVALLHTCEVGRAADAFRRALSLNPRSPIALNGLGACSLRQGQSAVAIGYLLAALALAPDYADAHNNIAGAYRAAGLLKESLHHNLEALRLNTGSPVLHSHYFMGLHYTPGLSIDDIYAEHLRYSERFAGWVAPPLANTPDPERRLKVGYVSPDLRRHPVGYFLLPALQAHDPDAFEICVYSDVVNEDEHTELLRKASDHWHSSLGLTHSELAARIRADGIDILVDLAGHTEHNRLPMFAERAAPVQVTWIGYFNTTAVPAMDYLIADAQVVPPGGRQRFTEEIVRLPESYLCYARPDYAPPVGPLPAYRNDGIIFGCFNNGTKFNHEVTGLWAQILHRCEGARLFLKTRLGKDPNWRSGVLAQFAELGIAPERLHIEGDSPHDELLAAYNDVDIALDPFPYSGGTTTCEALSMGVPVITLPGDSFVSRVSASILTAVGLGELVCAGSDEYVETAVRLAQDRERLASLRAGMRERLAASALGNPARFSRHLEDAYRNMWH